MYDELHDLFDQSGDVLSVAALAEFLDVTIPTLRTWAQQNEVPRVGTSYVFTYDTAAQFAAEVLGEEDDEDDIEPNGDPDRDPDDSDDDDESEDEDADDDDFDYDDAA